MPITLKYTDHRKLDQMIDSVFKAYADNEVSLAQAREAIAHVVTAAANDNEEEVRSWLEPERVAVWKEFCRATRPKGEKRPTD